MLVALFTSVICDSSFSLLPPAYFSPSLPFFTSPTLQSVRPSVRHRSVKVVRPTCEKRKPAGRIFITREQQVITLKADFSEQLQGRKESGAVPSRGFRVNGGNLRPVNRAGYSETAREAQGLQSGREREKREDRERKRSVRRWPREDGVAKKNCGKGRRRTKEWQWWWCANERDATYIRNMVLL